MDAVLVAVLSSATASVLAFLFQMVFMKVTSLNKKKINDSENERLAIQALLRTELRRTGKIYLTQGYIDDADKYDYDNLYHRYHNLGKNGVMDDMYNKVMALPIK